MPVYDFYCDGCGKKLELKMTFKEHEEQKNNLPCISCGKLLTQKVAPLRFKLNGNGWFGNSETALDPYGITDMELNQNLDMEKRVEDYALNMAEKDKGEL